MRTGTSPADIDFYFLVTSQLFWRYFPNLWGRYRMWSRKRDPKKVVTVTKALRDAFEREIIRLSTEPFPESVANYVAAQHRELTPGYIEWLKTYQIDPSRFEYVRLDDGSYEIYWSGPLYEVCLYEATVMSVLLELHARQSKLSIDPQWKDNATEVAREFVTNEIAFVIGGLRRRISYEFESAVTAILAEECGEWMRSTSNIRIAAEQTLWCSGTAPHVAQQAMAAIYGYNNAVLQFLIHWSDLYLFGRLPDQQTKLNALLTDTFTTPVGLKALVQFEHQMPDRAGLIQTLRNDSMKPLPYVQLVRQYVDHNLMPRDWTIVHSDGMNRSTVIPAAQHTRQYHFNPLFIIGTYLTHELAGHPGNDVVAKCERFWFMDGGQIIKPREIAKLSDVEGKHSGAGTSVQDALQAFLL